MPNAVPSSRLAFIIEEASYRDCGPFDASRTLHERKKKKKKKSSVVCTPFRRS